jgi:RNA polymerase subunit RPABC4/transcription elongation factor Spt4
MIMPFCPNCTYEYTEGIKECPDCGTTLVEELIDQEWVVVYTSDQEYDVQMIKTELESAGIESNILSQKDSNFPVTGNLAVIKLLVKTEYASSAINFINELKNSKPEEEE